MYFAYIQSVNQKIRAKKHHFKDEKQKEKIKQPNISC